MGFLETILFIPPIYDDTLSVKQLAYIGKGTTPNFVYKDIPLPIKPDTLMIRVLTAALNPVDLQLMNSPISVMSSSPKGIGRDFCGVIEEVGRNLKDQWKVGDKVCGMFIHINGQGTVASYININPAVDRIIKVPPNLSDEEAAAFPLVLGTALRSLSYAKLDKHSWICILGGATSVGQCAIQLAKNYYNVEKVVVTCSAASSDFCKELGADVTIDYRAAANIGDSLKYVLGQKSVESQDFSSTYNTSQVSEDSATSGGKRFQLIFDCAGGTDVVYKGYELLTPTKDGSAYVTVVGDSKTSSDKAGGPGAYFYNPAMVGRKLMSSTGMLGVNYIVESVAPGDWLEKAYDLMLERTVSVKVDSVYDWSDWKKALDRLESRKNRGKIVLKITT